MFAHRSLIKKYEIFKLENGMIKMKWDKSNILFYVEYLIKLFALVR